MFLSFRNYTFLRYFLLLFFEINIVNFNLISIGNIRVCIYDVGQETL